MRQAVAGDLPAIRRIYAHHVETGFASFEEVAPDLAEMTRRFEALRAAGFPYLVAADGDTVLGYAYLGPYRPRSAYRYTVEDSVYVAPEAMGRGAGRALLVALTAAAGDCGFRQIVAVIGDSANTASVGLHGALGFVHQGTLRNVGLKRGRWLDSVLMQLTLPA
ncbi:N-acetyltransferase family protein [Zavarzinia compransoris]|uniref:GNAT family N-acetyltransferase n=1 Tax=Zavarzinia marina TaxID=2911065 RepID=UPI001F1C52A8|nr:GNAT family N-acetyltransferase [Zavarzinia marina]MCF4165504.1 N-acetyltransferase family protein [Zavarzinia marina]